MLAIIFLSERVNCVQTNKNGSLLGSQQNPYTTTFLKIFNSTVMIEKFWFSVSNIPFFNPHTHHCPCDALSSTLHNCSAVTSSMTALNPERQLSKHVLFGQAGFNVFSKGDSMEAQVKILMVSQNDFILSHNYEISNHFDSKSIFF